MRALILALALFPVPAFADVFRPWPAQPCAIDSRVMATARAGKDGFRRLDRLPPAAEYLTVFRTVDRCPAPVVVRYAIGATPR